MLEAGKKLKVIGRFGIGVDNIDLDYCAERGIAVTNAAESNAVSVAEHTVGCMIAASRNFARFNVGVRQNHEWAFRNKYTGTELHGKILGVIGLGKIGSRVAKMCMAAFEMQVIAYDAYLPVNKFPTGVKKAESVRDVFKTGDFVSVHCPLTPETIGLANADMFACMKPSAYFINCARGKIMKEADLYEALKAGKLRGAALDVLEEEPPPENDPLFSLPNVHFTPHCASLTEEAKNRMSIHAAMGIDDVLNGRKPQWPVNDAYLKYLK